MVQSGAEGVLQALILSFGPLHFHNQHLEFNAHPRELHRDYMFRRINYGNNTHVNISVVLGEDNKASLFVSLDRNDKPYYACDAGCLDAPIQLRWRNVKWILRRCYVPIHWHLMHALLIGLLPLVHL